MKYSNVLGVLAEIISGTIHLRSLLSWLSLLSSVALLIQARQSQSRIPTHSVVVSHQLGRGLGSLAT